MYEEDLLAHIIESIENGEFTQMEQWMDDTLVAIEYVSVGKFRVLELPARATRRIIPRRSFKAYDIALDYIEEQYSGQCVVVHADDITEEIERRQERQARYEADFVTLEAHVWQEYQAQ